jgi:L-lactate permease
MLTVVDFQLLRVESRETIRLLKDVTIPKQERVQDLGLLMFFLIISTLLGRSGVNEELVLVFCHCCERFVYFSLLVY